VAIGDLNGDGKRDLVTVNCGSNTVSVLLGNGDGTFGLKSDFGTGNWPQSVAIGDLNGDGKPDLVTGGAAVVSVLLGNGDGTFRLKTDCQTSMISPGSVAIGDLDGDGKPDLVATNARGTAGGWDCVFVLLANGAQGWYWTGGGPHFVAVGDLNRDGKLDLVTANYASVSVLMNTGGHSLLGVETAAPSLPRTFQLAALRPNPSRGTSEIRFLLPSACTVDVALFDLAGRQVRSLVAGERSTPGEHDIRWDGRDGSGAPVRDGVYLVQVRAGRDVGVRKLVVLR
jgi:hypothetical protein